MIATAGINILWSTVLNKLRHRWGTTTPKNPMGLQKVVIAPANNVIFDFEQKYYQDLRTD
ncbi:MAG: hypothetical protein AAF316_16515 [Cyanobacteria bacterium P01_A01_bin.80]